MNAQDFCYWLQGKLEGRNMIEQPLADLEQVSIQDHLQLVFNKVTQRVNDGKTYVVTPIIDWSKTGPYVEPAYIVPSLVPGIVGDFPHSPVVMC